MIEQIWDAILDFTSQFVIPDWGAIIALLPVFMALLVVGFLARTVIRFATIGPARRRKGRVKPIPPPGVHMPGPTFAPVLAGIGTFLLFLGLVFGGELLVLGATALVLTLLYWGREGIADYDHVVGVENRLPAVVHDGPPPGVHMPGPSFRPILAALAVSVLFLGLIFPGWILAVGVLFTIVTLLGWLNDARKEYRNVVAADRTGHIENEPPPGWPKTVLPVFGVLLVAAVVLNAGWFPPGPASGGDGGPSPAPSEPTAGPGEVRVVAKDVKFDLSRIEVPAGEPLKVTLDNQDAGIPHDVDILEGGETIFNGEDFPGPEVRIYDVPPLEAGTYTFLCSIHPALMTGELVATE